jgi:hypothetical protein
MRRQAFLLVLTRRGSSLTTTVAKGRNSGIKIGAVREYT